MHALALVAAVALAGESLPPQNQPVNLTQIKGSPVGNTNPLPITCVSGCGGGGSGGGAVDQGAPAQIDGGWPVILVDQAGNQLGTVSFPLQVAGGGSGGGGGASWDAGVIVQFPVAIASLWDGGVYVQNFPAVQAASQSGVWVVDLDLDGGVNVLNFPATQAVSGTVAVSNFPGTQTVTGTMQVLQDSFPWLVLAPPDWDAGVEVLNWPSSFGASQTGNWAELMIYDGGPLPISGAVTVSGTVAVSNLPATQAVTQSGNWSVLMIWDGGAQPVSGSVSVSNFPATQPVSGTVAVSNFPAFPTVQAVSIVDGGTVPYDAGYLAYSYAGPLPADTSYQTSCTMAMTLCGTSATAFPACAGGKWQDFQNQSNQSIYICTQAGCSAPTAIDAGTIVGEQVQPFATYFANGSSAYWCVVPTSPQIAADAGTVSKCCK